MEAQTGAGDSIESVAEAILYQQSIESVAEAILYQQRLPKGQRRLLEVAKCLGECGEA